MLGNGPNIWRALLRSVWGGQKDCLEGKFLTKNYHLASELTKNQQCQASPSKSGRLDSAGWESRSEECKTILDSEVKEA